MNVLFLSNIPSPYRVDFFNELGKYCSLTVLFEKATSDERDKSWKDYRFENFNGVILNGISVGVDTAFTLKAIDYIKKNRYDAIICGGISSPTAIATIIYMKAHKIRYYIEADGGAAKSGSGLKEKLKKFLVSGAEGYFSTSRSCDGYFTAYGADKSRIFRYPFTSLHESDIASSVPTDGEKAELRRSLGLEEEHIIVSVGRFSYKNGYGKGYDTLLRVSEGLPDNIGIYIIGDEPTEEFKRWKEDKKLSHVHFLPFKQKDELFTYYRAADASVLLTRGEAWGLVINESMANGVPAITTDVCVGGVELIEDGKDGYITAVDDSERVTEIINSICSDSEKRKKLSENALKKIRSYTTENMAKEHIKILSGEKHPID